MGRVLLLECTLRDGGYINDWRFGSAAIHGIHEKLALTGIEIIEVGLIKGDILTLTDRYTQISSASKV